MSDFKITGPGFYRARNFNARAEVVAYHLPRDCWLGFSAKGDPVAWHSDGRLVDRMAHENALSGDIIAPWTEPKKGTVWVNVYADGLLGGALSSREDADHAASYAVGSNPRIACVSVNWTEGEGL